jgi:hypothetical protein
MGKNKGSNGDYAVGKGKPPREYCWRPGTSGNSAGRPRKKSIAKMIEHFDPFAAMVVKNNSKLVERRDAKGRVEEVTRAEAALERLLKKAMEGNVRAMLEYLKISKAAQDSQRDYDNEVLHMAIDHRDKYLGKFHRAEQLGEPVPWIFPHPVDVVIQEDGSVTIEGPTTESQHLEMLEFLKLRDLAIDIYDKFVAIRGLNPADRKRHLADLSAKIDLLNGVLPPRLRKGPTQDDEAS